MITHLFHHQVMLTTAEDQRMRALAATLTIETADPVYRLELARAQGKRPSSSLMRQAATATLALHRTTRALYPTSERAAIIHLCARLFAIQSKITEVFHESA